MRILANLLVALVALLHAGFLVLEMFLWTTPFGLKTFNMTPEFAAASATLAANQGLYNGFLAAGLVWGLIARSNGDAIKVFFLACVIVAGVFGAATAKMSILFVQALPAVLALLAVLAARRTGDQSAEAP
jgi:putative membrane protein